MNTSALIGMEMGVFLYANLYSRIPTRTVHALYLPELYVVLPSILPRTILVYRFSLVKTTKHSPVLELRIL